MSLYHCTIAQDRDQRQVIVHWDDHDPNRHIVAPVSVAADTLDEAKLTDLVSSMGFRIASTDSDNIGRGWAIVARIQTDRPFYNPLDQGWYAYLQDDVKSAIADKWPGARVPGVN
ncbi:hypothetical protein [Mycolicibacterium sp.]|uniref:hypothetical protein n=1 Tax=Mycolicibacterium sp. TaxID=2320850 RepID=UPI00355CD9B9